MPKKIIPMAIAYDFDGTLAPGNVQEHRFLPNIGIKPEEFWAEVKRRTKEHQADEVLMYMRYMLEQAEAAHAPVRREDFKKHGKAIKLFDGVEGWFDRIDEYAQSKSVRVEHYLISSGNAEIIEGTPIAKEFENIYASKFMFDQNGVAVWPALAVNYTTKTQFLFRINKGAHDLSDSNGINKFVEQDERPVPFKNIIYIGDGETDVPCFRLVKELGGLSIVVFKPHTKAASAKATQYKDQGRVDCAVPAAYNDGDELDQIVKARIDFITADKKLSRLLGEK